MRQRGTSGFIIINAGESPCVCVCVWCVCVCVCVCACVSFAGIDRSECSVLAVLSQAATRSAQPTTTNDLVHCRQRCKASIAVIPAAQSAGSSGAVCGRITFRNPNASPKCMCCRCRRYVVAPILVGGHLSDMTVAATVAEARAPSIIS
jgi:hypothetical protein